MEIIRVSLGEGDLELNGNGPDMAEITIEGVNELIEIVGYGPEDSQIIIQPSGAPGPAGTITPELLVLRDATAASRDAAKLSETNSSTNAANAANSKTEAANSATAANASKGAAATSEVNAIAAKNAASTSASAAAGSATLADQAADDSVAALTATETARDITVQAKADGIAARDAALVARDQAVQAGTDIHLVRDEAIAAKNAAVLSETNSKANAELASDSAAIATSSKGAAEAAATSAGNSKSAAVASEAHALESKNAASLAASTASSARDGATTARAEATGAKDGAVAARNETEAFSQTALQAKTEAEASKTAARQSAVDAAASAAQAADKQAESEKNQPGGYAGLDSNGKLDKEQLPPLGGLAGKESISTGDIDNKAVTLAKQADVASGVIMGRVSAGSGSQEALTKAQVKDALGISNINNTSDADKPISNAQAVVNAGKAPLTSPDFLDTPTVPTAAASNDSKQIANTAYVQEALRRLIGAAPAELDTIYELAAKLQESGSAIGAINTSLALKMEKANNLSDLGNVAVARTNLGLGTAATKAVGDFAPATHDHLAATAAASGFMTSAQFTKLSGIEVNADVTKQANVVAALQSLAVTDPVDTTVIFGQDRRWTWLSAKNLLKTYFDAIYQKTLGFTPVNKAGDTMTSALMVKGSTATGGVQVTNSGDASPGFVSFIKPDGSRAGYVGYASGTRLVYWAENGFTGHNFGGDLNVDGGPIYTKNGFYARAISAAANAHLWLQGPGNEDRAVIYADTNNNLNLRVAGWANWQIRADNTLAGHPKAAWMGQNDAGASLLIQNNGGTGDANLAMQAFVCTGAYGIKIGLRADGYYGLGGWSAAPWRWYSAPTGDMTASGNVIAYSDPRLKEDISNIENALEIVRKLNGVRFTWNHKTKLIGRPGQRDIGVLADEVEAVLPEIVGRSMPDQDNDNEEWKMVAYDKMVPVLIEAIKELAGKVERLENDAA